MLQMNGMGMGMPPNPMMNQQGMHPHMMGQQAQAPGLVGMMPPQSSSQAVSALFQIAWNDVLLCIVLAMSAWASIQLPDRQALLDIEIYTSSKAQTDGLACFVGLSCSIATTHACHHNTSLFTVALRHCLSQSSKFHLLTVMLQMQMQGAQQMRPPMSMQQPQQQQLQK